MGWKVKVNFGFISIETDVNLSDAERQRWADFLGDVKDFRLLSSPLAAEYVGEVFASVVRLRDVVLPDAERGLPAESGLRRSYAKMRRAIRDFLTQVRPIGRERLNDSELSLANVSPIGHQWIMVSALAGLRFVFLREIEDNCALLGGEVPEEMQAYQLPERIAEEYAEEVAPSVA